MTEDQIQIQFIDWLKLNHPIIASTTYHTPNGGKRTSIEGKRLKAMGVKAGVADLYFMSNHTYMELKTETGKLSLAQKEFKEHCDITGHKWVVAYGFLDAINKFNEVIFYET